MKLIIDIPEEIYKASQTVDVKYEDTIQIPLEVIANGTPIPDNATNGDMIKAIFPNAEYKHIKTMSGIDGMEVNGINGLYDNFGQWCSRNIFFHDDWWNAPYQKGGKGMKLHDFQL